MAQMYNKMPKGRKNPVAQAGNYQAEVDTTDMDPEMKETLGTKRKRPVKQQGLGDMLKGLFNRGKK